MKYEYGLLHVPTSRIRAWGNSWHMNMFRKIVKRNSNYAIISLEDNQVIVIK
jgi:hypothetical protein